MSLYFCWQKIFEKDDIRPWYSWSYLNLAHLTLTSLNLLQGRIAGSFNIPICTFFLPSRLWWQVFSSDLISASLQIFKCSICWQHWLRLSKWDYGGSKSGFFEDVRDLPWWMFLDLRSRIEVENVAVYWAAVGCFGMMWVFSLSLAALPASSRTSAARPQDVFLSWGHQYGDDKSPKNGCMCVCV